ncbi:MAG: DUF177 domain-containing protein [Bifidobacteriaceae bacterium]|nr:DUF177 domain-containing protein [Bifidobacteriaceae bacterium]
MTHKTSHNSPWLLPIAQVSSRTGQNSDVDVTMPAPEGIGDEFVGVSQGEEIHVQGQFYSILDGLIFTGTLHAPVHAECTRCLKKINTIYDVNFNAFFPYDSEKSKKKDENIFGEEEDSQDVYPLEDHSAFVDIENLIRDNLVTAVPLQPLCKEDCLGLCSQCGINLNDEPDHYHDVVDNRFASLQALKEQLENKSN